MDAKVAHLRPLTAFRFIAAAFVCLHHLQMMPAWNGKPPWPDLALWFTAGYAGVPFFFILSGFVLTWNYHDRFRTLAVGKVFSYLRARLARAYPLYLATFFLSLITPFGWHGWYFGFFFDRFFRAFSALTLTQGYWPRPDFYQLYNPVAWTLSAEALFYVLLPFVMWAVARVPGLRTWMCLGLVAGLAGFRVVGAAVLPLETSVFTQWAWYVFPLARLPEFLIGVLLAVGFLRRKEKGTGGFWTMTAAEVGVVALVIAQVGTSSVFTGPFCLGGYYAPTMALLVWVFAFQRGAVSSLLSWRPLQYLGELSYTLYLLHMLTFWLVLVGLTQYWPLSLSTEWLALTMLAVTLALCPVSFHLLESPARWLITGRRTQAAKVVPTNEPVRRAA